MNIVRGLICAVLLVWCGDVPGLAQPPVHLSVQTTTQNDTLVAGVLGSLHFRLDSLGSTPVSSVSWPLVVYFSNGNVIGAITETGISPNIGVMPWPVTPDSVRFSNPGLGADPDTVLMHLAVKSAPYWTEPGELWRISFVPTDSGKIIIDTASGDEHSLTVLDDLGQPVPVVWTPDTITVVPYCPSGDLNDDGIVNDKDLYILIRHIQLGGPPPSACLAHADVNGDGTLTFADIIIQIHYTYHGDRSLCYTCGLIEQGIWSCP